MFSCSWSILLGWNVYTVVASQQLGTLKGRYTMNQNGADFKRIDEICTLVNMHRCAYCATVHPKFGRSECSSHDSALFQQRQNLTKPTYLSINTCVAHIFGSQKHHLMLVKRRKLLGKGGHFLEELNLSDNRFDADAARRILETALRDRCRQGLEAGSGKVALWLDLSHNCIKRPQQLFEKLEVGLLKDKRKICWNTCVFFSKWFHQMFRQIRGMVILGLSGKMHLLGEEQLGHGFSAGCLRSLVKWKNNSETRSNVCFCCLFPSNSYFSCLSFLYIDVLCFPLFRTPKKHWHSLWLWSFSWSSAIIANRCGWGSSCSKQDLTFVEPIQLEIVTSSYQGSR